jgi:hypothetical protein
MTRTLMNHQPVQRNRVPQDYSQWSIEELWELASQLRVAGARHKSRRELIDLFAAPPNTKPAAHP